MSFSDKVTYLFAWIWYVFLCSPLFCNVLVILCWVECNYWVIIYYLMLTSLSTQIIWVGMRLIMLKPPCYAWVNEVNLYDSDLFGIKCSVLCVNMIMDVNDFLWLTMFCNVFFLWCIVNIWLATCETSVIISCSQIMLLRNK